MSANRTGSVFIIGAGGLIGEFVARAFRRHGYTVYGLVRKQEQAKQLRLHEVIPVIGDATDSATWKEYVEKSQVIIDATILEKDHAQVARNVFEITNKLPNDPLFSKKVFIYCSGIMVYGHDEKYRDETSPIGEISEYSKWRGVVERFVLQAKSVIPIVIRPGWVYGGRELKHSSKWFSNPEKLVFYGEHKDRRYSWIHVEDCAEFFVAAAKKGALVSGEVFNAVGYDTPKWVDLATKGSALAGYKGEVHWEPNGNSDSDILRDANVILSPQKGIDLLGWQPKHIGLLENLEFYYESYKLFSAN